MQPGHDGTDGWDDPHPHRRAFGRELRVWYESRGLTLRGIAELLDCGFAVIHRATQGRDWLAPWTVVRADWCLGADRRLVESFAECWLREQMDPGVRDRRKLRVAARHHRDPRVLLDPEEEAIRIADLSARIAAAVASLTPEMKRRVFLKWSSAGAASLPLAAMAGGVDGMEHLVLGTDPAGGADAVAVEQIRDTIGACRQLDDQGMSATVLGVGRRALARVDELLRGCTSAAARRSLTLVAGELCQVVGNVAAGLHEDEMATRYTARAIVAADEAGSAELHAYAVSLNVAYRELYCRKQCDLAATADAATAAQEWARRSGNPTVVSHAQTVAARAHARAGREPAARSSLACDSAGPGRGTPPRGSSGSGSRPGPLRGNASPGVSRWSCPARQPWPGPRRPPTGPSGRAPTATPSPGSAASSRNGRRAARRWPGRSRASAAATAPRPSPPEGPRWPP